MPLVKTKETNQVALLCFDSLVLSFSDARRRWGRPCAFDMVILLHGCGRDT
jgi:hypothetical protein